MSKYKKSTTNYSNRSVDILLLQYVRQPVQETVVRPDISTDPRITTGVEKLVQRYTQLFLTQLGTVKNREDEGTDLISKISTGKIYDIQTLSFEAAAANNIVMRMIKNEDTELETPDDEALSISEIKEVSLNRSTATVSITVALTTESGDTYTYVTPIKTGV